MLTTFLSFLTTFKNEVLKPLSFHYWIFFWILLVSLKDQWLAFFFSIFLPFSCFPYYRKIIKNVVRLTYALSYPGAGVGHSPESIRVSGTTCMYHCLSLPTRQSHPKICLFPKVNIFLHIWLPVNQESACLNSCLIILLILFFLVLYMLHKILKSYMLVCFIHHYKISNTIIPVFKT